MAEMTSRELVTRTLRCESTPRVPRDLWTLPWAEKHYPAELAAILRDFPNDLVIPDARLPELDGMQGDPWAVGTFIDEWGCAFTNLQEGVIGEVKEPLVASYESDLDKIRPPADWLKADLSEMNRDCENTDKFTLSNAALIRIFERMQFVRGTENVFIDLVEQPAGLFTLRDRIHEYNLALIDRFASTNVDAIGMMDDWGTQRSLLISPKTWRAFFKPCYKDYVDRIHAAGKFCMMHSDGHIFEIYEDLIEIGVDAINSQLFCMDIEEIGRRFKGRITFWGEVDRQHILPAPTPDKAREGVRRVASALYDGHGGVFAQCEFGAGAKPENVRAMFEEWDRVSEETNAAG